jgi:glycine/D-amino acid oxidase-like deaminating enzyme
MARGQDFDAIVVGAGLAGLACAAELVYNGRRPLLVCETAEVGSAIKSTKVAGNLAMPQIASWNIGWGGGWWMPLVRKMNVPLRYYPEPEFELSVLAGGQAGPLVAAPRCGSAVALADLLSEVAPWPIDAIRSEFEKVIGAGLNLPYPELLKLDTVPCGQWVHEQGVSEMAEHMSLTILATLTMVDPITIRETVSVFGAFAFLRTYLGGDGMLPVIYPDNREGLAIPLAKAIEARGGTIWRSAKAAKVLVDGEQATGLVLQDGREVMAPVVALATGNNRIAALLDPLPTELKEPLDSSSDMLDFYTYTALDRPVASTRRAFSGILDEQGVLVAFSWPMHAIAPWSTQPGQQLVVATSAASAKVLPDLGGADGVYQRLDEVHETYWPGYRDAIIEQKRESHSHLWYNQLSALPRIPRTIESVRNLWFVNEGSKPIAGIGFEAACSAGVLGARDILAATLG